MTKDVSMLEQANEIYSSALRCKEDRDYEQAVVLFRKAITILESEAATGSKLCHAFYQVGVCFRYLGNYDDSIQFLEKALASKVKKTDSFVSSVHHRLAIALRCRGEYASAIYHYQRAIAIQERQNPGIGSFPLVLSFVGLAAAYCELGNYHESEDLIDKAFAVVACIGSESEASGLTSYHYGILCEEKEKWDLAMENFVQARVIFENFQNHEMVASCEREIAMVNTRLGNYSRASEFLNRALRALMSTGRLTVELAAVYNAKGFLSTAKPDYDDALLYFAESEKILAETVSCSLEFAKTCAGIADVLLAQGNLADALWRFQQALSIYDCHHCRCSAVSTIAHKIEVLEAKIAAENEMQTGIRTAVAIPVAIQLQQSMVPGAPVVANRLHSAEIRSSTTHCPSVLAWPAEDNSFAGRLPLAESISGKLTILGEHHSPFGFTGSPLAKTPIFAETDFDCAEELLDSVAKPESTNAKSSLLESTRSCPKIAENNALILVVVNDDNQSDDNEWIATLNKQFELVVVDSPPSAISFLQEGTTMPDIIVSKLQLREESGDDLQLTPDNGALFVQLVRKAGHSIPIVTYGSSFIRLDLNETETIQLEGDGVVFGSQNLCQVISKCIADANQISTTREYEESAANSDLDIESPVGRLDNGNLSHSAIKNNDVPSPLGIQAPNDAETNDNQIQNAQLTGLDEVSERMPNVEGPTADAERCVGKRCTNAEPPAYYFPSELSHDDNPDSDARPGLPSVRSLSLESTRSSSGISRHYALVLVVVNDDNQSNNSQWISTLNKEFELVVVDSPPSAISFLQEGTTMPDIIVSKLQLREESGDDLQLTPDNGASLVQLVRKAGHSIPIITYDSSFIRLDLYEAETIQLEGDGNFGSQNLFEVISKCIADANQISTTREYEESAANSDLDIESPVGRLDNGNLSHSAIKNNDVPSPLGIQAPNDAETNDNQIQNAQLTGLDEVSERMPNVEGPTADAERCVGKRCTNAEPPAYYFSSELSDHDEDDLS